MKKGVLQKISPFFHTKMKSDKILSNKTKNKYNLVKEL